MRARGLFIGINYTGTKNELRGCVNDANNSAANFKMMAEKAGYQDIKINMLTDFTNPKPVTKEILQAMAWLVVGAAPGDVLFLHYSGHGSQMKDDDGDEADGFDESICALDGQIRDDTIKKVLAGGLPEGVTLYCVFDCCHSGTIMDLRCVWDEDNSEFVTDTYREPTRANVFMLSGCLNIQTSADLPPGYAEGIKESVGALTNALLSVINEGYSWAALVTEVRRKLKGSRLQQIPQFETGRDQNANEVAFSLLYPSSKRGKPLAPPPGKPLPAVNNHRIQSIHSLPPGPFGVGTAAVFVCNAAEVLFKSIPKDAEGCAVCVVVTLCVGCILQQICGQQPSHNREAQAATEKYDANSFQFSNLSFVKGFLLGGGGHRAASRDMDSGSEGISSDSNSVTDSRSSDGIESSY